MSVRRLPRRVRVDFSETRKVCERKRRFTLGDAAIEAGKLGISYYRCPRCGEYHLTSIPTGRRSSGREWIGAGIKGFDGGLIDHGDFEHEDDELFAHLHNYGWGRD